MKKNCDCYRIESKKRYTYHPITGQPIGHETKVGVCWGTKEIDECKCDGDMTMCDFYPEVRAKARKELKKNADTIKVIRCKDCNVPHNKWTGCPKLNGLVTPPDFYCALAEPKER